MIDKTTVVSKDDKSISERLRSAAHGNTDHGTHHDELTQHCAHCQLLLEAAKLIDALERFGAQVNDERNMLLKEIRES